MLTRYRKPLALCVCVFILGILLGIGIAAKYHHNDIHFQLDDMGELSLAPQEGDVIDWVPVDKGAGNIEVTFAGGLSPCVKSTDSSPCVVTRDNGAGTFAYACKSSDNTYVCVDPAVGPISKTGGKKVYLGQFFRNLIDIFRGIIVDFKEFFSSAFKTNNVGKPQQFLKTNSSMTGADISSSAAANSSTAAVTPFTRVLVQVDCSSGTAAVGQTDGSVDQPILVSPNTIIGWKSPNGSFSLTMPSPSPCSDKTVTDKCTILSPTAQTYQYTVACTNQQTPTKEYITVSAH